MTEIPIRWLNSGNMLAAVFDGHGGVSAGQYLCKQLYEVLSDAIDEETYGEECSLEGAL